MAYEFLSRSRITQALRRLGELAHERKVTLEIALYGGDIAKFVSPDVCADVVERVRQQGRKGGN